MKFTTALLVLGLFVCGCAAPGRADRAAAEFLGPGAVNVLAYPTKVEGWNFQRADGTIVSEPAIRPLDLSTARQLGAILLDDATYRLPSRGGGFEHTVGFRVWRGSESIDVLLSFANDQVLIKSLAYNGQPTTSLAGVTGAHDALFRVARGAFPDYKGTGD